MAIKSNLAIKSHVRRLYGRYYLCQTSLALGFLKSWGLLLSRPEHRVDDSCVGSSTKCKAKRPDTNRDNLVDLVELTLNIYCLLEFIQDVFIDYAR